MQSEEKFFVGLLCDFSDMKPLFLLHQGTHRGTSAPECVVGSFPTIHLFFFEIDDTLITGAAQYMEQTHCHLNSNRCFLQCFVFAASTALSCTFRVCLTHTKVSPVRRKWEKLYVRVAKAVACSMWTDIGFEDVFSI